MTINQILEQDGLTDRSRPQFNEREIIDSITSEEPYVNLKKVFDRSFFPKVIRWLESKLEKVKPPENAEKMVGGELRGKLDVYLDKDKGQQTYESNAKMLVRELLNSIDKWNEFETKPRDLPDVGL